MKLSTYEDLKKLLQEFCEKRDALQIQIDDNVLHIQEAEVYAQKITNSKQKDFDVFSPRRTKEMYKSELEQSNMKKADYEELNARLIQERDQLNWMIDILERVADESKAEEENEENKDNKENRDNKENKENEGNENRDRIKESNNIGEEDFSESLVEGLKNLNHKIGLSAKFIRLDPVRAKSELNRVTEDLQSMISDLEN